MTNKHSRLIAAVERAVVMGAHDNAEMTDKGMQRALSLLREAEPVARAMVLLGNPLDSTARPLEQFCQVKRKQAAKGSDDPEGDGDAAEHNALFFLDIALGLLLAEQVP